MDSDLENTNAVIKLKLPTRVIGPTDVSRLWRELEALEEFFGKLDNRQPHASPKLPRTSKLLDDLAAANKLNLLEVGARKLIGDFLVELKKQGPVLQISFASEPAAVFMDQLVDWMRDNIHPELLILVGLEPSIAAGCIVRTAKHQFDFSLRQRFLNERQTLIQLLDSPPTKHNLPKQPEQPKPDEQVVEADLHQHEKQPEPAEQ